MLSRTLQILVYVYMCAHISESQGSVNCRYDLWLHCCSVEDLNFPPKCNPFYHCLPILLSNAIPKAWTMELCSPCRDVTKPRVQSCVLGWHKAAEPLSLSPGRLVFFPRLLSPCFSLWGALLGPPSSPAGSLCNNMPPDTVWHKV